MAFDAARKRCAQTSLSLGVGRFDPRGPAGSPGSLDSASLPSAAANTYSRCSGLCHTRSR
ncbi:hypothetical protein I552_10074 [Mycobacterium xenopi 3993]|nr:hypothetical protein I552_10074 [Mycobacterium xenopi 3993]